MQKPPSSAIAGIACGRLTGVPFLEFVRARTDWQARQDLGSLYRFLLRFVTAEALALRVPTIAARYFDYVKARSGTPEEGTVPGILEGIPLELVPWWIALLEAYVAAVLELAGRFSASFENGPFEEIGEKDGRRLVRIHTRVSLRGGREAVDPELADI